MRGAGGGHLGKIDDEVYRGADDNAARVAVLVEVARAIAKDRDGRGVIVAAFDGEEPPHFVTGAMGSREFVRTDRDRIDLHPERERILPSPTRGSIAKRSTS